MEFKKEHIRQILLFYFFKGKSAAQATRILQKVYGDEALKERQTRNWFSKFKLGNFSLKDEPHTGRPSEAVDDEIKSLIDAQPYISTRGIADILQVHFSTVDRHLQRLGYTKEHNKWILRVPEFATTSRGGALSENRQNANEMGTAVDPLEDSKTIEESAAIVTSIEIIPSTFHSRCILSQNKQNVNEDQGKSLNFLEDSKAFNASVKDQKPIDEILSQRKTTFQEQKLTSTLKGSRSIRKSDRVQKKAMKATK